MIPDLWIYFSYLKENVQNNTGYFSDVVGPVVNKSDLILGGLKFDY